MKRRLRCGPPKQTLATASGNADLADQRAVRVQAVHAVAGAGPQAAGLVDAEAVEQAGSQTANTSPPVSVPVVDDVEDADVARAVGVVGAPVSAM